MVDQTGLDWYSQYLFQSVLYYKWDLFAQKILAAFLWFYLKVNPASSSDFSTRGLYLLAYLKTDFFGENWGDQSRVETMAFSIFEYFSCLLVEFLRTTEGIHS